MRNLSRGVLTLAVLIPLTTACGMLPGMGGVATPGAAGYQPSQASKDTLRSQEATAYATADAAYEEAEGKLEADLQKALKYELGLQGITADAPAPAPGSANLLALRKAGIKVRIEAVTNEDGAAVANNFVQMKDSFTDRLKLLQPKMVDGTATGAEKAEVQKGVKYVLKLNDAKMQLSKISIVALTANAKVQTGGLTNMMKISNMVRSRKMMSMDFNDDDWARVKKIIEQGRRTEIVAGSTLGMLAAYQAVVGSPTADPKGLDVLADATLKSFPLQVTVTDEEAHAYVDNLSDNAAAQKAKYEGWMRAAYGDAKYEAVYKAGIDRIFDQAASAGQQKSVGQMQADTMSKYNADLAKCARGEDPGPGSMVGPAKCKEARASGGSPGGATAAGPGLGGGLLGGLMGGGGAAGGSSPDAKAASPPSSGLDRATNRAAGGVSMVQAAANGDVAGTLDGAVSMFPGDGPIQSSLKGIAAIAHGDPKGAITAAIGLVPGGSMVKQGLSSISKMFGFG
jgi:hypothetical protein